ncbi:MAG: MurR/RpiR family transcriptional regulator [Lactobacillus sp.]|jgi:DNA-binding MurR/RpiR family transcriptional regulator|uniref:MurR/RpiR family transcriptional regulator n=1 Tax=Lacticaseibacillus suilingensis TaxID=2799577 RepID=A0ABW4BBM4_9LACO|nr:MULTISPECIES: MurR/RpiR family transcriptional regulator [Lacticaseibacillus]MCI1894471.1 MurR/RpiR family transcriptional regulator [Lactobacillus sp.]MCI1916930.1 MurR/RpiR family transcriptional regulator [Lactobacillus sp.]MCI1941146.1 MurR/RpiR family transcriptional regulator [Lactobacillus sp.]MCI1971690.1 MurR/RpiR family transcriptional regulator [Lactobacillus sp.]MCI2016371.1 MurR/RpiR family transcriptional regulator [Lactobacillus sp.]
MFPYDKLRTLNGLESAVYTYINQHQAEVEKMTIRQLAEKAHVSTTTILRFAGKMGFEGYSELRYAIKQHRAALTSAPPEPNYDITVPIAEFFENVNTTDFAKLIDQALTHIVPAPMVLLCGIGTGQALAEYGARFWSNIGKFSLAITDPYYPFPLHTPILQNTVMVALSVSGESHQVIEMASRAQQNGVYVIAVTNHADSTLAQLSDMVIAYYMPEMKHGDLNLTTQVPIIYLIELIAHRLDQDQTENANSEN